jgi:hypothetical protein
MPASIYDIGHFPFHPGKFGFHINILMIYHNDASLRNAIFLVIDVAFRMGIRLPHNNIAAFSASTHAIHRAA